MGGTGYNMTADAMRIPSDGTGRILALDMAEREGRLACFVSGTVMEWCAPVYCPFADDGTDRFPASVPIEEKAVLMLDHVRHILDSKGVGTALMAAACRRIGPGMKRMLIAEAGRRGIVLVPVDLTVADAFSAGIRAEGRDLVIDQRYDRTVAAEVIWHNTVPSVSESHVTTYGWSGPYLAVKARMDMAAAGCGNPDVHREITAGIMRDMRGILDGTVGSLTTGSGTFAVDRGMLSAAVDPASAVPEQCGMGPGARVDRRYFERADRVIVTGTADTQAHIAGMILDRMPEIRSKTRTLSAYGALSGAAGYVMMRRGVGA